MVHAGISDLTTMKIRNGLVLLFLLAFVVLAPFAGFTAAEIGWSAAAAAGVLVVAFILFALGWIGGGDAKLAAVTVLWLGADHAAIYLIYAALLGGVLTVGLILLRTSTLKAWLENRHGWRDFSRHNPAFLMASPWPWLDCSCFRKRAG